MSYLDLDAIKARAERATESMRTGAHTIVDYIHSCRDVRDVIAEVERLRKMLFAERESLSRAFCEGEGWTEDYGWPIGEHTAETMADFIIAELARLRADRRAIVDWIVNGLGFPLDIGSDHEFPTSWRIEVADAWWGREQDEGLTRDEYRDLIFDEAGWERLA